jgi:hypothetical protein
MASLYDSVKALLPTTVAVAGTTLSPKVYDTRVHEKPAREYFVLNVRVPDVTERSEAATRLAHGIRVWVTSVGRSGTVAREFASAVERSLDQAEITPDGWVPCRLLLDNTRGPDDDPDVVFTDGGVAIWALSEFVITASRTV